MNKKLITVFLGLALTGAMVYATEPTIKYEVNGTDLILTYSGTLCQSTDAISWTEVAFASSPYTVVLDNKKLFFCAKGEFDSKDFTIPLTDDVSLGMIWIKPGTFMMGTPEDELGRYDGDTQHEVTLTQGYWLGKYEITQVQYEAVMGKNPSKFKGRYLPAEQVSWDDATNFCAKLTIIEQTAGRLPEGYEYTLPTEAQWEYACRAGTTTALNSGKNLSNKEECPEMDEVGWYKYNSNETSHQVGQNQPNAWGLYDMHGNVLEWCLDRYEDYPASSMIDPLGLGSGKERILRGGSWFNSACDCRSARRNSGFPSSQFSNVGFRVALTPVRTPIPGKDTTIPLSDNVYLDMVWIEPGTFMMGSPKNEPFRNNRETQHQVTLTKGYWLGKYELTQEQYKAVTNWNPSEIRGDDLPVEQVRWSDAMDFCAKLTAIEKEAERLPEGYEYTLPTEAQWEYACRAGTTTSLNSGKYVLAMYECPNVDEVGWYRYSNGELTHHPVGLKQPNAWGLYDMHGNVVEWCLDWYGDYPITAVTDPTGPSTGSDNVVRGGSWRSDAYSCRSAYRDGTHYTSDALGFRVALVPIQ